MSNEIKITEGRGLEFEPSDFNTPAKAANAFYKALVKFAKESGYGDEPEIHLGDPEESDRMGFGKYWSVTWEGGPYYWGVSAAFGMNNYGHWMTEPYYSFNLVFYDD